MFESLPQTCAKPLTLTIRGFHMASKNNSNEFGRFQDAAEKIIARLKKKQIESIREISENDLYQLSQAEIRGSEEISKAKEWIRYVLKNAHEDESYKDANRRLYKEIEAKEVARIMQIPYPLTLPQWPENKRALPNGMLRSALFGAIRKGRRRYLDREPITAIEGVQITYTGIRLDQNDLDVYESVLHALRAQEMGKPYKITTYSLLKTMGKKDTGGKGNRKTLEDSLSRLRANAVILKQGQYTYIGGLLDWAIKDEKTKQWIISLNPTLRFLYEPNQFTWIDWEVRKQLSGQSLAQWLHCFYASHAEPYPIKIESLLELAGSENANPRSSHQKLKKALDAVVEAFKAIGQMFSYDIKDNTVYVKKQPSKSQKRYLQKRNSNR